jgi:hypothetical protein
LNIACEHSSRTTNLPTGGYRISPGAIIGRSIKLSRKKINRFEMRLAASILVLLLAFELYRIAYLSP